MIVAVICLLLQVAISPCTEAGPTGNCKACDVTSPGNCASCNDGYYLSNNDCVNACQLGCKSCNGPLFQNCFTCMDGYFKSSSSCSQCFTRCKSCRNSSDCTACQAPFYLQVQTSNESVTTTMCVAACTDETLTPDNSTMSCTAIVPVEVKMAGLFAAAAVCLLLALV